MALDGPAGSGKTYTALTFAFAISNRVAVVDSEHASASLYAGLNGWNWDGVNLESFAPSTYTACIEAAARKGYEVLVIDSLSHAWSGTGGALAQVDREAGKPGGTFAAWRNVTPQHQEMIDQIRKFPGHVIITLRSKMEYALEEGDDGRKRVQKLGMKPIQREGVEYEFDIVGDMDTSHRLTVTKTRYSEIDGKIVHKPGPEFMLPIISWLKTGKTEEDVELHKEPEAKTGTVLADKIKEHWRGLGWGKEKLVDFLQKKGVAKIEELPRSTGEALLQRVELKHAEKQASERF